MSDAEITANNSVGGIAGDNQKYNAVGTITDCYSLGKVSSTEGIAETTGNTTIYIGAAGGIVGYNYANAIVTRSISEATISATYRVAGGIVGRNLREYIVLL